MEARLNNISDLATVTAPHHFESCGAGCRKDFAACIETCSRRCTKPGVECSKGCETDCTAHGRIYYYYPRVSVDFSSSLLSTSGIDRLSYLAMIVRIKEDAAKGRLPVRFLDFHPKDADLAEFSRGDLTQSAQVTANANIGSTEKKSTTTGEAPLVQLRETAPTLGATTGVTLSESLVSKLADAIEKKTTSILEQGQTFFADLRSIRQLRVAGSYNYDLMLEVPATPDVRSGRLFSMPVQKQVVADVFLIGIVRHVYSRGRIGVWNRVPESENDHVYEQVILEILPDQTLWQAPLPWVDPLPDDPLTKKLTCEVKVLTNRDDGGFVAVASGEKILSSGKGHEAILSYAPKDDMKADAKPVCATVEVRFLPVILPSEQGPAVVLEAQTQKTTPEVGTQQTITGAYRPRV